MMSRDCQEIRELLDSYAAGELLVETNHRVLRHLGGCAACREELAGRDALRDSLRRMDAPDRAPTRLAAAIHAEVNARRRPRFAVAAATCLLSLSVVLAWQLLREQPLSAAVLLEQATSREHQAQMTPEVVKRVLVLEERLLPMRELVGRRRVEVWRDGRRGLVARRAFDDTNQLVAGEWRGPTGGHIYRRGASPTEHARLGSAEAIVSSGEIWRLDLSVATVAALRPRAGSGRVSKASPFLMLEFEWPESERTVSRVQLFLRPDDLHPVEQRLTIQLDGSVREVRLLETEHTSVDVADVAERVFTPDPELVPSEAAPEPPRRVATRPKPPVIVKPTASLDMEISLLHAIHRLNLLADGRATVVRLPSGRLELEAEAGLVEAGTLQPLPRQYAASVVVPEIAVRTTNPPEIQSAVDPLFATHQRLGTRISILVDLLDRLPREGMPLSLDMAAAYQSMVRDLARAIGRDARSARLAFPAAMDESGSPVEPAVVVHSVAQARLAVRRLEALAASAREAPASQVSRVFLAIERQAGEFDNPWPLETEDRR
ncbi:MAG TPA: zf-HC2 domain-containing protein [Vicinamibacterales bacterium]